jgi:hypothetical protein
MPLSVREAVQLKKIIGIAEKLVAKASSNQKSRRRRTGKELKSFRKMLVAERKRGVSVAKLAKQHGVSASYIYQL